MNVHDSEKMASLLSERLGWSRTEDARNADVVVFNTCAVRQKAEDKLYSSLVRFGDRDAASRPLVVVGGCVAQLAGARLRERFPSVDVLIGPRSLHRLPDIIQGRQPGGEAVVALDSPGQDGFVTPVPAQASHPARALVTIIEGCNQVCSFCVVPRTRGTETCLAPERVVSEVEGHVARGRTEIMLLGQTVNAYRSGAVTFPALLRHVGAVPGVRRLRFVTSHPRYVDEALAEAFATIPTLCPQLHLPFQSGADRILAAMRRGYDHRTYLDRVFLVRRNARDVALWTDVIVGYPGETEEDFQQTLDLVGEVGFAGIFAFTYSPRPGTTAAYLTDDVPDQVKRERLRRVNELQQGLQAAQNRALVGTVQDVLVESVGKDGRLEGRNPQYRIVHCAGDPGLVGRLLRVRITWAGPNALVGEMVSEREGRQTI